MEDRVENGTRTTLELKPRDLVWGLCWLGSREGGSPRRSRNKMSKEGKSSHLRPVTKCTRSHLERPAMGRPESTEWALRAARSRAEGRNGHRGDLGAMWGCEWKFYQPESWMILLILISTFALLLPFIFLFCFVVVVVRLSPQFWKLRVPEMNKWCNLYSHRT